MKTSGVQDHLLLKCPAKFGQNYFSQSLAISKQIFSIGPIITKPEVSPVYASLLVNYFQFFLATCVVEIATFMQNIHRNYFKTVSVATFRRVPDPPFSPFPPIFLDKKNVTKYSFRENNVCQILLRWVKPCPYTRPANVYILYRSSDCIYRMDIKTVKTSR